jgi:L-ascorbate metabolism protein UlaG (beta-lactamase superfamily)
MKTTKIFLIIFLLSANTILSQTNNDVNVTYVGNAGFLIQVDNKKILIDALFRGFEGGYQLPEHIQEKLMLAQAPFNDVDLIVVTHANGDHIDIPMVAEHMKNNPKAKFASTKQLVDALNARDTIDHFQERRIDFNPSKEKSDKKEIQGITIETFFLPHGSESRIINIGFLISVNGINLVQTGDADFEQFTFEEFQSFGLLERNIDLSFIQHYYLIGDSLNEKIVREAIGGKYIFPIHYQYTTPAFDASLVKSNFPEAIIFEEELYTWQLPNK